jgi:uncharacterized protein YjbI with pentapeptide repeats
MTERRHHKEHGRLRRFWIVWRGWVVLALVAAGIALVLAVLGWFDGLDSVLAPYISDAERPASESQRTKTFWDWMDLLLVPVVLAIGALFFAWVTGRRGLDAEQKRIEEREEIGGRRATEQREIEADRAREIALRTYLDRMSVLLLNHDLGRSQVGDKVRLVAQARTLTVLRQLDGVRTGLALQFLYESDLIGKPADPAGGEDQRGAVVDLQGADLSRADLAGANLRGANLRGADLFGAKLFGADLSGAHLVDAVLVSADLRRACLVDAQLVDADLFDAHLVGADLYDVDLNGANLRRARLIGADLEGAHLGGADLYGADLFDADLRRANLRHANLVGADLEGAQVTDEQLADAESLEGATLPDGTVVSQEAGPEEQSDPP